MNACEHVTDLLPELAAGMLSAGESADLHAHIRGCEDCASEWMLIAALRDAPKTSPELAGRITVAVTSRPLPRYGWGARQLTIAATIVMAMLGTGIAIQQYAPSAPAVVTASDSDTSASAGASTAAASGAYVSDPAVGNGSVLPQLTEPQLEALLAEMGS